MTKRPPTHEDEAGQTYLALRKKARAERRTTDELIQLHALEAFIDRLTTAVHGRKLILKGGALLAAFDVRRPTRDVDLSAQHLENTPSHIRQVVQAITAGTSTTSFRRTVQPSKAHRPPSIAEAVRGLSTQNRACFTYAPFLHCQRSAYVIRARFGRPDQPSSADLIRSGLADLIRLL